MLEKFFSVPHCRKAVSGKTALAVVSRLVGARSGATNSFTISSQRLAAAGTSNVSKAARSDSATWITEVRLLAWSGALKLVVPRSGSSKGRPVRNRRNLL